MKWETLCLVLRCFRTFKIIREPNEQAMLLLINIQFLNYLIDKFHPLELINVGIFGSWSIVGFIVLLSNSLG